MTVERAAEFEWLPDTCAYRLRHHNLPLPAWHPLISGSKESARHYGVYAVNPVLETEDIDLEDLDKAYEQDLDQEEMQSDENAENAQNTLQQQSAPAPTVAA